MLPHVDEFRPVHNLESLAGLIAALAGPLEPGTQLGAGRWRADKRLGAWQTELLALELDHERRA